MQECYKTVTMHREDQWQNTPQLVSASLHQHEKGRQSMLSGTPVFVAGDAALVVHSSNEDWWKMMPGQLKVYDHDKTEI